jgi:hypothetical protein
MSNLYIHSPNVVTWDGFKDSETDTEVNDATLTMSLFKKTPLSPIADGPAVPLEGGDKVGIPCTGHGLSSVDYIRLEGSINYNDEYAVDATSTANQIVIVETYVAETFLGTERIFVGILNGINVSLPYTGTPGEYRGVLPHTLGRLVEYSATPKFGETTVTGLYYLFVKAVKDSYEQLKRKELQATYDS